MTRNEFVEKEIKRTEKTWAHYLLGLAFLVIILLLYKVEPIVIGIFFVASVLGMLSGYKLAFDRIRRREK